MTDYIIQHSTELIRAEKSKCLVYDLDQQIKTGLAEVQKLMQQPRADINEVINKVDEIAKLQDRMMYLNQELIDYEK
jgi:hypothetical protein